MPLRTYSMALVALLALSAWRPYEIVTWAMEVAPVAIVLPILWATHKRFPLTPLLDGLIFVPAAVPMLGGHYSYARVPLGTGVCLGVSALYELIEWGAAIALGQGAEEFLGTQGDPWDTQKDMALAWIGAMVAQWLLARWHDRQLAALENRRNGS